MSEVCIYNLEIYLVIRHAHVRLVVQMDLAPAILQLLHAGRHEQGVSIVQERVQLLVRAERADLFVRHRDAEVICDGGEEILLASIPLEDRHA